jgi:hypothetical protein
MSIRKILALSLFATGCLAGGLAQAHDEQRWPHPIARPAPMQQPGPAYAPQMREWHPTRWDVDGDGIPNRHDRFDDRRLDRDHDGIPDRFDRVDNRRWHDRRWHRHEHHPAWDR